MLQGNDWAGLDPKDFPDLFRVPEPPGYAGPLPKSPVSPVSPSGPVSPKGALDRASDILGRALTSINPGLNIGIQAGKAAAGPAFNTAGQLFVNGSIVILGIILIVGAFMLWGRTSSDAVARYGRKLASEI